MTETLRSLGMTETLRSLGMTETLRSLGMAPCGHPERSRGIRTCSRHALGMTRR
jgi:hypothetical protein